MRLKQKLAWKWGLCFLLLVLGLAWPPEWGLAGVKVTIYKPDKVYEGTTLIPFNQDLDNPRIIEVDMEGNIVWEYQVPDFLRHNTNPGFDVDLMDNGNLLVTFAGYGVVEMDREGNFVWEYRTRKVSHDADPLPNGNVIMAFGDEDTMDDAQVREVNRQGEVVWQWFARSVFGDPPYSEVSCDGYTHTNGVVRLDNGDTLVSLRNFDFLAQVDSSGNLVRIVGEGVVYSPHGPGMSGGHLLVASQRPLSCYLDGSSKQSVTVVPAQELDLETGQVLWQYGTGSDWEHQLTRHVSRLPNGNTLVVGSTKIVEVTSSGEVVWQLEWDEPAPTREEIAKRGFYVAIRIPAE